MTISFSLTSVLLIINFNLAIFWIFILHSIKADRNRSDQLLIILLACIAASIASSILHETGFIHELPHLLAISFPLNFVIPPVFYLYIRSLTRQSINYRTETIHFLPALLVFFWMLPFYLQSADKKIAEFNSVTGSGSHLIPLLIFFWELIYIIYSLILLYIYANRLTEIRSNTDHLTLSWVRNLIIAYMIVAVYYIISEFYPLTVDWPIGSLITFILLYLLGYLGFRQNSTEGIIDEIQESEKYKKSGLTAEQAEKHLSTLLRFMEKEKPYLDSNLTLKNLAERISISSHHLSQLLNDKIGQSFYDFINTYRVNDVKKYFSDPQKDHYKILAIAYEVGFNSKSHFNQAFKRLTQMTPSQFKNDMANKQA